MANMERVIAHKFSELILCTNVGTEMCCVLRGEILCDTEFERLQNYAANKQRIDGARYLYDDIYKKIAGVENKEKQFLKALEVGGNVKALYIIKFSPEPDFVDTQGTPALEIPASNTVSGLNPIAQSLVGRELELNYLTQWWTKQNEFSFPIVVSGLGGIGKTRLVQQFATLHVENCNVLWLDCGSSKLQNSISNMLKKYTKTTKTTENCSLLQFIYEISKQYRTLIVFDELENFPIPENIQFVLNPPQNVSVIVTSRNRNILEPSGHPLKLSLLTDEDAMTLLKQTLPFEVTNEDSLLGRVCSVLQNFPLGIIQVGHYTSCWYKQNRYNVRSFLNEFKCSKAQREILSHFNYIAKTISMWDETVGIMFNCVNSIENDESHGVKVLLLLKMLSYGKWKSIKEGDFFLLQELEELAKKGIWEGISSTVPVTQLKELSPYDVRNGLRKLLSFSLLEYEADTESYSVHKLLQMVTRLKHQKRWIPSEVFITSNKDTGKLLKWNFHGGCPECFGNECPNVFLS